MYGQGDRFDERVSRSTSDKKGMLWGMTMFIVLGVGIRLRQGEWTEGAGSMLGLAVLFLLLAVFDE